MFMLINLRSVVKQDFTACINHTGSLISDEKKGMSNQASSALYCRAPKTNKFTGPFLMSLLLCYWGENLLPPTLETGTLPMCYEDHTELKETVN